MKKLYIIGNGFDLHHEIKSSYTEFGNYVQGIDPELHDIFEKYFSFEGNWADLENTLAHIDVDTVVDDASDFLVSYAAEDWSDSYHHDYQYEVDKIVEALSTRLKRIFTEWVLSLNIPDQSSCAVPLLNIDRNSIYLNFNYTDTLRKLYKVNEENILHIHNRAIDSESDIILGHAINPLNRTSLNDGSNLEEQDVRVTQANQILDSYFSKTYKPTAEIITRNSAFFPSLSEIKYVYVAGHSLSEVDIPYFKEIIIHISKNDPEWVVTYFCVDDMPRIEKVLNDLGLKPSKVKCIPTASL